MNNLKGEVEFRRILARQHVNGEMLLPNYYGKEEHDQILLERIDTTRGDFERLRIQDFTSSPFLEMGAERCHRSLVMVNDYQAQGFAIDISLDQLKSAGHFASLFGFSKLPIRICCDANNLPFRNNSFPFVFSYEFLHHFPSPRPILKEIYRVMSNGMYYFNEEPFKTPHLNLYKQKNKIYSKAFLNKSKLIKFLERYISVDNCDEREYGVIENMDISLNEWIRSLEVFNSREVSLNSSLNIKSNLGNHISLRNLPNVLLGGSIKGKCQKDVVEKNRPSAEIYDLLCCPDCISQQDHQNHEMPPLVKHDDHFSCQTCNSVFPIIDNVIILLPGYLLHELYPEIEKELNLQLQ